MQHVMAVIRKGFIKTQVYIKSRPWGFGFKARSPERSWKKTKSVTYLARWLPSLCISLSKYNKWTGLVELKFMGFKTACCKCTTKSRSGE